MPPVNSERSAVSDQQSAACGLAVEPSRAGPASRHGGSSTSCRRGDSSDAASTLSGQRYWRSLEELADTGEFRDFVQREFGDRATELLAGEDRRQFLKVMGASLALAGIGGVGLPGCRRWPEEKIAPYAHRPPGHAPGTTNQYATCMELGGVAQGLLVTSYDYRPIKVEGNPLHPINGNADELAADLPEADRLRLRHGATDAYAQASVLDLYDPDRSQHVLRAGANSDWAAFASWAGSHFAGLGTGAGVAVLAEASSSPSLAAMKMRFMQQFAEAAWHEYEPLNNDNVAAGMKLALGAPHRAHYSFDQADVIVALDSDFLCSAADGPTGIKHTRDWVKGRRADDPAKPINRLYVFESGVSLTGANADHRVAMRSSDVAVIAARIAQAVMGGAGATSAEQFAALASAEISTTGDAASIQRTIDHLLDDLQASEAQGRSIVLAGPRQPAEVHLLVHLINQALGNVGQTVRYTPQPDMQGHAEAIRTLGGEIENGRIHTLIIIGGNPAYNAPADLNFSAAINRVPNSVHLSEYVDETSALCTWHVNRAHYLEAWGDGRAHDGTYCLAQPLIQAMFGGRSAIELLAAMIRDEHQDGYEIVRRTFRESGQSGADFESSWRRALHDGVVAGSGMAPGVPPTITGTDIQPHLQSLEQTRQAGAGGELELLFTADSSLYDGRFANNGWLQELPDPLTRIAWDNAVVMGLAAAQERGLTTGDMAIVTCNNREVTAPVFVLPGHHAGSVTLALGYGRAMSGRICAGAGTDFYKLRTSDVMGIARGSVTKAAGHYTLATTQDHHAIDSVAGQGIQERLPTLFREATLEEYRSNPRFAREGTHVVHRLSLWDEDLPFHTNGDNVAQNARYAWAMSIDMNACTGCGACVVACQAENNIPIVGKDQVVRNREMHWIRVDRYFRGGTEAMPDGFMLAPVTCMHCENAPCEQVCPVAATVHDEEGVNVMVYNRCVGTRYCSNNCPYKVRRFNYFDYHRREPYRQQPGALLHVEPEYYTKSQAKADPLRQMQFNPEVTVRMRGIMEKCTYCVQRITEAKIDVKNDWVKAKPEERAAQAARGERVGHIPDGAITPACAQACPAQAIVFGDLNDRTSRVAKLHKHNRTYEMLEELNTKPRTRYMAKVRNPAFGGLLPAGHHAEPHPEPGGEEGGQHNGHTIHSEAEHG